MKEKLSQINIVLDIYSGIICLFLILYFILKNKKRDGMNRFFILMCLFNLGMLLGDITNWTCEGFAYPWFPFALRLGTTLYFGCSAPLLLSFIGYTIEYLSSRVVIHKNFWYIACILSAIQLIFSVISLWTGTYYIISTDNVYHRGDAFWLSQLIPILIYSIAPIIIIFYYRYFKKKDILFLLGCILMPLTAEFIQMTYYGIALMNTGSTLALLIVFINVQLESELKMKEQEKALTEARIDIMMSQIQPHFLYNSLATIRKLCDLDPKQAKQAIGDFSFYLRANMDSLTNKLPIPFMQELNHVKHYLNLEQQRFQSRLKVVYDINVKEFLIPALTVQTIVENAVRHGIMKRERGGTIIIYTEDSDTAYRIIVIDDGPGFNYSSHRNNNIGIGIDNVRKRLQILCNGQLELLSNPNKGVTAIITIPKGENQ